jgi:uncharacterized membrane protein YeaQ/YmgE (transglycosylase-associated protein family)
MLYLLGMLIYAVIVGLISKAIMPRQVPIGLLSTVIVGIIGSYTGGLINFLLGRGHIGQTSGIIMGVVGGVIALAVWRWWKLKQDNRTFWTGKSFI